MNVEARMPNWSLRHWDLIGHSDLVIGAFIIGDHDHNDQRIHAASPTALLVAETNLGGVRRVPDSALYCSSHLGLGRESQVAGGDRCGSCAGGANPASGFC